MGRKDDTGVRVLMLKRDPSDERTGVFISGIVSVGEDLKIALYFTGSRHAGENLAQVLKQRSAKLPSPIQMCDALSRNVPKVPAGVEILLANYLAHGRRQFVDVAENFPNECRYALELLGQVYLHDAEARARGHPSAGDERAVSNVHRTANAAIPRKMSGERPGMKNTWRSWPILKTKNMATCCSGEVRSIQKAFELVQVKVSARSFARARCDIILPG